MNDRPVTTVRSSIWTVALASLASLFAIVAFHFALQQSVWTDEATQLSGLSLSFLDQLRWLSGRLPQAFSVPPDRTPPLSYWLGSLWTSAFGDRVLTTRCLSVCLSIVSVFALWGVARQYLAQWPAFACAVLLALSPNFVVEAVEVRAYAAFILFSVFLVHSYLRLLAARPAPSSRDLWIFTLAATLCSYTHFFGIVISAGAFLCLLASYRSVSSRSAKLAIVRKARWPVLLYAVGVVGLVPFIFSALKNSPRGDLGAAVVEPAYYGRLYAVVKLIYRFFGHQSMLGVPGLSAAAMVAGVALVAFSTLSGSDPRARQMVLLLFTNLGLVALVSLGTHAFNAFASTYNVWALPVIALLGAAVLAHGNRYVRIAGTVGVGVLIVADAYAAIRLSTAGEIYGHTRSSVLSSAVDAAGADNVIVLYANDAPSLYFALMYRYHNGLRQYIDRGNALQSIGPPGGNASNRICDLDAGTLLVVRDQDLSAEALQFLAAHPGLHTTAYQALDSFLDFHHEDLAPQWTLTSLNDHLAQSAMAMAILKGRARASPGSTACNAS